MSTEFFTQGAFAITASRDTAATWAGRPDARRRAMRLAHQMFNRSESSLDVLWANFGSGKSHFLLHLIYLAEAQSEPGRLLASYVEVPEQTKQFLELYRRIVSSWPVDEIASAIASFAHAEPDLERAAQTYIHGGAGERSLVKEWITGGRPALRELKNASGISTRIDDDIRATELLSQIVSAFGAQSRRVLLCLDEFQRLALNNPKQGQRVMQGLRTLLSANGSWLSVVVGIASRAELTALEILPPELRTLIGVKPGISLPALDEDEALLFVRERMAAFRPADYDGDPAAPFGEDGLLAIVRGMAAKIGGPVSPRQLLQALAHVYEEAEFVNRTLGADEIKCLVNELTAPN